MSNLKPGDRVYYRGDWDPDCLPTEEDIANYAMGVVIQRPEGLRVIWLNDDTPAEDRKYRTVLCDDEAFFPTIHEALFAAAAAEEEYGRKTLALAARLRELAANVEKRQ